MRIRPRALPFLLVAAATLSACGSSDAASPTTAPVATTAPAVAPSSTAAPAGGSVVVKSASSDLGDVLVGPDGRTMYGFTNDPEGASSCSGTCADAWPPVVVGADWKVGPELDSGIFSTIAREDGTQQLTVGRWPLYYYSGDAVAGDVTGQGSGGVWFVAGTDGKLIEDGAGEAPEEGEPAPGGSVALAETDLGSVLVDGAGLTLYGFLPDEAAGLPTCTDACATTWPAAVVDGEPEVGEGIEASLITTVEAADGGSQLKAGKWPLYTFSGDAAPGDVNGQGSGGSWFVVGADGKLIKEAGQAGGAGGAGDEGQAPTTAAPSTDGY